MRRVRELVDLETQHARLPPPLINLYFQRDPITCANSGAVDVFDSLAVFACGQVWPMLGQFKHV
jgi:hypothetical protein